MTPDKKRLGLRLENFFKEDKEKARGYECVICKCIFSDNYNLECNHCICDYCIKIYEKCPEDDCDIIFSLNAFNGSFIGDCLLEETNVYCIFKNEGCKWQGNFNDFYDKHINQCEFNLNKNNKENEVKEKDDYEIIIDDESESDENNINNSNMLNKKRKHEQENKRNKKEKNYSKNKNKDIKEIKNNNTNINIRDKNFSIFQQRNIINNILIMPEDNNNKERNNNNISNSGLILEKYFFENYNNTVLIDENLTKNIFPYNYYFTEPLNDSFNCQIEVISREFQDNKGISFGLTNINNNTFKEIISTKDYIFLFLKGDIIKILYDSNYFYINSDNRKINKSIFLENKENIKYYPTIILNNKADILKVSHN